MLTMTKITGRGARLLSELRRTGVWMTRAELAEATGKAALSPNDRNWLDRLQNDGLIERQERSKPEAVIGYEYVYRSVATE